MSKKQFFMWTIGLKLFEEWKSESNKTDGVPHNIYLLTTMSEDGEFIEDLEDFNPDDDDFKVEIVDEVCSELINSTIPIPFVSSSIIPPFLLWLINRQNW